MDRVIFVVKTGDGFEETRRTSKDVAHEDVRIFRFLGKKAWVEEEHPNVPSGS